jgi:hypothetical protein
VIVMVMMQEESSSSWHHRSDRPPKVMQSHDFHGEEVRIDANVAKSSQK